MNSHNPRNGSLATRLLRLHEALEKVEERSLLSKQQVLTQLAEEEQTTAAERDMLFRTVVAAGTAEQRSLSLHQWMGVQARLEHTHNQRQETSTEVDVQQQRLQAAHVESERWRTFYQTDAERASRFLQTQERRELDEAALMRHRPEGFGEDA